MTADPVARIARTVLYEGYVLWPYRRSATKNRQRWTFGGVHPPGWSAEHPDDPCDMRTECLVEGPPDAAVDVEVRFLQVVERRPRDAAGAFVDELEAGGSVHLAWEEARERTVRLAAGAPGAPIEIPAGVEEEPLEGGAALVRSWHALRGAVHVTREAAGDGLTRVGVRIENATPWEGGTRAQALARTFASTHTVLRVRGGAFVSLIDPPDALRTAAQGCRNERTWPVLVGEDGERHTMLSSPIILYDHPQVAPESPGDLFDGTEIDQLLILNVLGLTEEEQREARASDPRAREILDRCGALSRDDLMRLHGTLRDP